VFVGLIAGELLHSRAAAWIGAAAFATTLHSWTQWNGEQYGLALAFVSAGLYLALRGRTIAAGVFWALAMISHSEFMFAAPVYLFAMWVARRDEPPIVGVRRIATAVVAAGGLTAMLLLIGTRLTGRWHD